MTKQDIITKMRGLRDAYGRDDISVDEMVSDLGTITGLPPAAIAVAESAYRNANREELSLDGNTLVRVALNTVSGAAKRGAFDAPVAAPAPAPARRSFSF